MRNLKIFKVGFIIRIILALYDLLTPVDLGVKLSSHFDSFWNQESAEIAEKREKNEKIRTLEAQLGDQSAMVQRIQALEAQIQEMELNGVKSQINEESGQAGEDVQEEGAPESEIEKIQNSIPEEMKGEIDMDEIKARLADQLTETVKKGKSN